MNIYRKTLNQSLSSLIQKSVNVNALPQQNPFTQVYNYVQVQSHVLVPFGSLLCFLLKATFETRWIRLDDWHLGDARWVFVHFLGKHIGKPSPARATHVALYSGYCGQVCPRTAPLIHMGNLTEIGLCSCLISSSSFTG